MHPLPSLPDVESIITPMLSGLADKDAHETIKHLMLQGEDYMRSLKSLHNKHIKISSLSPEVLSSILVKAVEPRSDFVATSWSDHVQLTAVCKIWRALALDTPAFWTCIPLGLQCEQLPKMIARSMCHPLSVRIQQGYRSILRSTPTTTQDLLLPALLDPSRLEEFHFFGHSFSEDYCNWAKPPHFEAALLRSLKLKFIGAVAPIPVQVLSIAYPRLRHLYLAGIMLDWVSLPGCTPGITDLTTLHLESVDPPIPGAFLWSIISSSPNLASLTVNHALPIDFEPPVVQPEPFPRLYSIHIKDTLKASAILLLEIGSPADSQISLETTDDDLAELQGEYKLLLTTLLKTCRFSYKNQEVTTVPYLRLATTETGITLHVGPIHDKDDFSDLVFGAPSISLTLPCSAFTVILEALSIEGPYSLELAEHHQRGPSAGAEPPLPTPAQWHHFFGKHPSLVDLVLTAPDISAIVASLDASLETATDFKSSFVLPQLKTFHLFRARMNAAQVEDFKFMLYSRSRHQLSLETLIMIHCQGFAAHDLTTIKNKLKQWGTTVLASEDKKPSSEKEFVDINDEAFDDEELDDINSEEFDIVTSEEE